MTANSVTAKSGTATPTDFIGLTNSLCDAQALLSGLELGLFTTLRAGPADPETIRTALGISSRGLTDWLDLLVCNGVLERDGDRYRNSPAADRYLVRDDAAHMGDVLRRRLFPALFGLTDALRTGTPHRTDEFMQVVSGLDVTRQFASSMDYITDSLAPELVAAYDGWSRHRSVLDVGGCRGNVVSHILAAQPRLRGHVFDLPMMAPFFQEKTAELGLGARMTFHPGDFFSDPLPPADVVVIGHALVNWDADQRRFLVHKAFGSVNPGGVLLVYDRMLGGATRGVESHNLRVSLSMLVMTKGGSGYTLEELRGHARDAGFASVTHQPLGTYDTLAVCHKAA
ncbi:methyltransferase [Streptomyces sp. SBT349]|uniref:methyltransferase n=1 Tax=Streptomyces sp. SBT349 TaxID=1580539 RepID=UPI00066EACCB|nr:methyltransferase [Streptomyces sp. SBT349]